MTIDLTDTSTGAISQALTEARRRLGGMAMGMVLTLIIVTDEAAQYDAIRAANQAAREHPCRILAIISRKPKADSRLDAEIRVGEASPGETIVLRMYGPLGQHADSVVAPLLVPDVPVVTWWPYDPPADPAAHPLGVLAQRRVTDSAATEDAAEPGNPTADLIAAWLCVRLRIPVRRSDSAGPGITAVVFGTEAGDLSLTRLDGRTATLSWPGRPDRSVALHRRETAELLAEELRRLDPDDVYAETLQALGSVAAPVPPWTADA